MYFSKIKKHHLSMSAAIHTNIITPLIEKLYSPISQLEQLQFDKESSSYHAASFVAEDETILFRKANITPKKIGQFVTLWKRNSSSGETQPFDTTDQVDRVIILVTDKDRYGVFIFSADILRKMKIFTHDNIIGKRGFRVYAPWDNPENKQAMKTKEWQIRYFEYLSSDRIDRKSILLA
ncbi:MepB protein [Sphingobacterium spiritivorum ATCC 33300]|uniref:MepB protein n=1 Tax=Sphingobacterium spiritivorum ATCC 33300 TaxID=525372 RepID=C2FVF2_SPHSI|nr:MepB family protein [Sphingobacterium spiritivorum]EEI93010.1 MepB protein [Sphingobacterium spiritivorum ATCC 33300]QQS96168.1 MepB family protein [Sphingobacterium spiritivorum]